MTAAPRMLIAQISDTHVVAAHESDAHHAARKLRAVIADINALDPRPDILLATGDLVNDESPAQYAMLAAILAEAAMPVHLVPGNHDHRGRLRAAFPAHAYLGHGDGPIQYALDGYPVRILALDTLIPGSPGGEIDAARIAWADAQLASMPDHPTLVALHHPPFRFGMANFDTLGFTGAEPFEAMIARHRHVVRIVCGHVHRAITVAFGNTTATVCPSTVYAYAAALHGEFRFDKTAEPPGYQLHFWDGARLATHTVLLPSA